MLVVYWINVAQDRNQWRDIANVVLDVRLTEEEKWFLTSWATISYSRNTVLHGDGLIVECGANVFILSQTSGAVKRWLLAVHTFTCCPILAASGPPSPACEIAVGTVGGGGVRSTCHIICVLPSELGSTKIDISASLSLIIFPSLASNLKTVTQIRKGSERQLWQSVHDLKHQSEKTTVSTIPCTASTRETQHNDIHDIFMSVITNIHELLTMSVAQVTRVLSVVGWLVKNE
jgi:hypothetical protein